MKQQVNLYLPEFHSRKDWLDFAGMLRLLVAFVALLGLYSGVEYWNLASLENELAGKRQQLSEAENRTENLVQQFGPRAEDQGLAATVQELEETRQAKKVLLDFLENHDPGNAGGLSEYLADLSRFHVDGLRLTSMEIRRGGETVLLGGQVTRAENVPLFLRNLSRGRAYAGKEFETLRISGVGEERPGDAPRVLNFDVASNSGGEQ